MTELQTCLLCKAWADALAPVQAMKEKAEAIKAANVRIFVRRGGPNYQAGLALMRQMGQDTGIPVEVFGPETSMTVICAKAIDYVKGQQ